jgi:hypothetical protein
VGKRMVEQGQVRVRVYTVEHPVQRRHDLARRARRSGAPSG